MTGCHFQADSWNFWFPLSGVHSLSASDSVCLCVSHRSRACGLRVQVTTLRSFLVAPVPPPARGSAPSRGLLTQAGHCPGNHFLMRTRGSNKEGLDLGPHTRVHCSATFCKSRTSVLQVPRLPSAQKDLEGVGSIFPGGENRGSGMKISGHRLVCAPVGPWGHCLRSPIYGGGS